MNRILVVVVLLVQAYDVAARAVFAHFMWEHARLWSTDRWAQEIAIAQESHIDAFALNMAFHADLPEDATANAFKAADKRGFKLFLSLDYAGNGPWPKEMAQKWISWTSSQAAIYKHNGEALVSTFEGPGSADDFLSIKAETNIFFCPDWSSVGAKQAAELAGGVADCLFAWAAWPEGNREMDNTVDDSYRSALARKPFMAAVSPWFFTNLPGYGKNWLWKGDSLWYDRWQQILALSEESMPEFIQIISWNDYGESHHIGPLSEDGFAPFEIGKAPYNYAKDMPHDHWRDFLPFVIDQYKNGNASAEEEGITVWFRETMGRACATGGTTGNTALQGQQELAPYDVLEDNIYVAAMCATQRCRLRYRIGNSALVSDDRARWRVEPNDGVGIYQAQIPISIDMVGQSLSFELVRDDGTVVQTLRATRGIKDTCVNGISNWNPVVEGKTSLSNSQVVDP